MFRSRYRVVRIKGPPELRPADSVQGEKLMDETRQQCTRILFRSSALLEYYLDCSKVDETEDGK